MLQRAVRKLFPYLTLALCTAFAGAAPGVAQQGQEITLSLEDARNLANQALAEGNNALAAQIALGLLQVDPDDFNALMVLATASVNGGQVEQAIAPAKHAFSVAPKGPARLNAARLLASAHFRVENFTRAEIWLRRAANNTSNVGEEQAIQQDFNAVRRANPLSVQLSFSLAPNSNINNGSQSEFIYIWNLPFRLSPDARALAGYEVSGSVDLRYRLSESEKQSTHLGFKVFGRTYELTAASAQATTGISGGDFSFALAELSLSHLRMFDGMSGPSSLTYTIGANWYGGDPYTEYHHLTLGQEFRLSDTTSLNFSLNGKHEVSIRDGGIESDTLSLNAAVNHRLKNGALVGLSLGLDEVTSPDPTRENIANRAQISYQHPRPVLGMSLSGNMSWEHREFGFSVYDPSGRRDETLGIGVTAVFVNLNYFGFSPSLTLEASQTQSNVALFSKDSAGLRMGLQSTF